MPNNQLNLTWNKYGKLCEDLAGKMAYDDSLRNPVYSRLFGIPRGGVIVANILSYQLDLPLISEMQRLGKDCILILVDDIVDSGATIDMWIKGWKNLAPNIVTVSLIQNKGASHIANYSAFYNKKCKWINFPYNQDNQIDTISKVQKR